MYIIRDIFRLKFGHFRPVKELMQDALQKKLLPNAANTRVLTDFTGNSYRLILEISFPTLGEFEKELTTDMARPEWQEWYRSFSTHVESSYREILKQMN